jgi:hypothetical protein
LPCDRARHQRWHFGQNTLARCPSVTVRNRCRTPCTAAHRAVNEQFLLEVPRLPVAADKVAQGGAACSMAAASTRLISIASFR